MKSRNFSIRLSIEVYELLNKIALHTGMRKREIIEKAILEFVKNNYGELLSKDANEVLKESLEKSISLLSKEEKEEMEKWRKVLLRFISYHIMKTKLLYNYTFGSDAFNQAIPKRLNTLKSYENSLIRHVLKLLPEIENHETTSFIIKFVEEIDRINSIEIEKPDYEEWGNKEWVIKKWGIFDVMKKAFPSTKIHLVSNVFTDSAHYGLLNILSDSGNSGPKNTFIGRIQKYVFENLKFENLKLEWGHYKLKEILTKMIIENLDYYLKPILEKINKENNTDFKSINQLFDYTQQLANREAYIDEITKIQKAVILDFIKYLEKSKNRIEKGKLPKKSPKKFIISKTEEYCAKSQIINNVMIAWKIYNDLFNSITKEFIDSIINDVESKVVSYIKEKFKNKIKKRETFHGPVYYYDVDEKDLEAIEEELRNVLFNSVKS